MALFTAGSKETAALFNAVMAKVLSTNAGLNEIAASCTATSSTYGDPTTGSAGPTVTITSSGTLALVLSSASYSNSGSGPTYASVAVSGATSIGATDVEATGVSNSSSVPQFPGFTVYVINPGTNTYTLKYKVLSGTGTWTNRKLFVWAP
jgi:hypothetical protein